MGRNWSFITLTHKKPKYYRDQFNEDIVWLVRKLKQIGIFRLVPELTKVGDIHYHIMIIPSDLLGLKIMIAIWKGRNGYVDVSIVKEENEMKTFIYMMKEKLLMRMGYKYHMITESTVNVFFDWLKERKRSTVERLNIIEAKQGIMRYFTK